MGRSKKVVEPIEEEIMDDDGFEVEGEDEEEEEYEAEEEEVEEAKEELRVSGDPDMLQAETGIFIVKALSVLLAASKKVPDELVVEYTDAAVALLDGWTDRLATI
jgi:hypothetical protein